LGVILVNALLSVIGVSDLLQRYMNKVLGPFLILAGMVLLELISIRIPGIATSTDWQLRTARRGVLSAGLLGMVFALSFCPVSAALFFGSLIPLSVDHGSSVLFPSLYGLGTGLPVVIIGLGLGMGAHWVGSLFNRLATIERWARRITGVVFVLVGVYLSLVYIFGVM
jgi:cytochrome c biogenesis protein CcdA